MATCKDCVHNKMCYLTHKDGNVICCEFQNEADVAPVVHGHWEWVTEDKYRCSVCGAETRVDECLGEPMYKGCPYCLAIMDGEDGETDGTMR